MFQNTHTLALNLRVECSKTASPSLQFHYQLPHLLCILNLNVKPMAKSLIFTVKMPAKQARSFYCLRIRLIS